MPWLNRFDGEWLATLEPTSASSSSRITRRSAASATRSDGSSGARRDRLRRRGLAGLRNAARGPPRARARRRLACRAHPRGDCSRLSMTARRGSGLLLRDPLPTRSSSTAGSSGVVEPTLGALVVLALSATRPPSGCRGWHGRLLGADLFPREVGIGERVRGASTSRSIGTGLLPALGSPQPSPRLPSRADAAGPPEPVPRLVSDRAAAGVGAPRRPRPALALLRAALRAASACSSACARSRGRDRERPEPPGSAVPRRALVGSGCLWSATSRAGTTPSARESSRRTSTVRRPERRDARRPGPLSGDPPGGSPSPAGRRRTSFTARPREAYDAILAARARPARPLVARRRGTRRRTPRTRAVRRAPRRVVRRAPPTISALLFRPHPATGNGARFAAA